VLFDCWAYGKSLQFRHGAIGHRFPNWCALCEAELLRLQGEVGLAHGSGCIDSEIESMFPSAIDGARHTGARVLLLCAASSLAKFLRRLDRAQDAEEIVASAQSEFSEGLS
jgi:hypothetical protein